MPTPITFTLTNAGLNAALDADANGLTLSLTQIGIGSGKYTPLATRTALQTELARYPLAGGDVEPNSKTLRFAAVLESSITRQAFEVGLFTSTGVLFAVASTTGADPLILLTANIAFVGSFGMVVSEIPAGSVTVVTDPNAALAVALMAQHVAASNPHPQYAMKAAFDGHVSQNAQEHTNLANLITAEATARANADTAHTAAANPHAQYAMKAAFDSHVIQNGLEHENILSLLNSLVSRFQGMLEFQYAVGCFYWTDQVGNPNTWLQPIIGYETFWRPIIGRSLMSIDPADLRIDTVGGVFGAMVTTLGIHNLPPHDHADGEYNKLLLVNDGQTTDATDGTGGEPNLGSAGTLQSVGASVPFNNVHPVYLSYCWQRYDPAATQPTVLSLDITDNLVAIDLHDYFVSRVGAEPIAGSDITFVLNASNHIVGEVGVLVKSSAIYTGVWPAAVTLTFINNGLVAGGGGTGAYSLEGLGGERVLATSGGVAFTNVRTPTVVPEQSYQESNTPLHIINNGTIARGAGGGGLGALEGAGGGGAPFGWAGLLGYENTATLTTGGSSGGGGVGGNLAMAGANGSSGDAFGIGAPAGGLAIDSTGPAAITITDNGIILNGVGA